MKISPLLTLAVLLPLSAQAHVVVSPQMATADSYAKLVFQVPHGCDGSATKKITIQIPEGVVSIKPQVHPGWKISTQTRKLKKPISLHGKEITESISEVSFSGGPLPDEYMDEFGMSVKLPNEPNTTLMFAVNQECEKGSTQWNEKSGAHPAPQVMLHAADSSAAAHHH
jgi:uncharacterized protein YcnI